MSPFDLVVEMKTMGDADDIDRALDIMFQWADDDLHAGGAGLRDALDLIDVNQFGEDLLVGFLVVSHWGRKLLTNRSAFVDRVRARFNEIVTPQSYADSLIAGLA